MNDLSELQQGNIIFDEIIKNSSAFSEETKAKFALTLQEFKNLGNNYGPEGLR